MPFPAVNYNTRFDHHPPTGAKIAKHESLRSQLKAVAISLDGLVPDGREKSLMVTHLEEALMWGNAAIARSEDRP